MRTTTDPAEDFGRLAEPFRRELVAYGYRMLGSIDDAEEIVRRVRTAMTAAATAATISAAASAIASSPDISPGTLD